MKKYKKKYILILIVLLILSINFFYNKKLFIEDIFKDISYKIVKPFLKTKEIKLDNDMLISQNDALKDEIKELNKLLNIKQNVSSYKLINAFVINRSMENFYSTFIIDKGYNDNVKINDAVITNNGLVGKIVKLSKNTSVVKMITSSDLYNMFSVSIQTKTGDIYGILSSYDENTNSFLIEGIDELTNIEEGDNVVTTGLGENYPSGLNIGKVVRISKDNFDLAYILKVDSYIDFHNFHYVAVINRDA